MEFAATGTRVAIGLVFFLAGLSKIPRSRQFESTVRAFEIGPPGLVRPIAWLLPRFEVVCGLALLLGLGLRVVGGVVATMLVLFSVAVAINLLRGREIDCGCAALGTNSRITRWTIVRNLALAAGATLVALFAPRSLALDQLIAPRRVTALSTSEAFGMVIVGSVAVADAMLVQRLFRVRSALARVDLDTHVRRPE